MAVGDGDTWDETTPTDATLATQIDDYNRDVRLGVRKRLNREHEFPASQAATSEGGAHRFVTLQTLTAAPTLAGTQVAGAYTKVVDSTYSELFFARTGSGAGEVQITVGTGVNVPGVAFDGTSINTNTAGALIVGNILGTRVSKVNNTVYEASTDGVVIINQKTTNVANTLLCYVGATNPPATTIYDLANYYGYGLEMHVRKGEFWKVNGSANPTIKWMSIGT